MIRILNYFTEPHPFILCPELLHLTCYSTIATPQLFKWGCLHGVMVKVLDCGIVVTEFELQNTLGKGMNPFILLAMV